MYNIILFSLLLVIIAGLVFSLIDDFNQPKIIKRKDKLINRTPKSHNVDWEEDKAYRISSLLLTVKTWQQFCRLRKLMSHYYPAGSELPQHKALYVNTLNLQFTFAALWYRFDGTPGLLKDLQRYK